MIVPDANLLLYATEASSPFHDRARRWWQQTLSGDELVAQKIVGIVKYYIIFNFLLNKPVKVFV